MLTMPSMPQTLIPAVSFLAWFIVNWLKHSTLPTWGNALIALLVPLFTAVLWAIATGAFTASSFWGSIAIIVVLSYAALALPELEPWRQWLQDTFKSPFAWWPQPSVVDATTSPVTPYPTPTGLDLRSSAVPPSRRPQFVEPSPSLHSRPMVQITVPQQAMTPTTPPPEPEPPTPVEESPAPTEQS